MKAVLFISSAFSCAGIGAKSSGAGEYPGQETGNDEKDIFNQRQ